MKMGLFKRFFLLYAVILALAVLFAEIFITAAVRQNYITDLKKNLAAQISLVSDTIPFDRQNVDTLSIRIRSNTGARVTIISPDGTVIGDSDKHSASMDNHADRPEITQTKTAAVGTSVRHSATLNQDFLYVAKQVDRGKSVSGYIRLSVPLKDVHASVNLLRIRIIVIVGLIVLVLGLYSVSQTEYVRRLIQRIRDYSKSLAQGEIDRRLVLDGTGEFDEIARNLHVMSDNLKARITESEEERKRLSVILRSIPDALLIIDTSGIILDSSAAARKVFGNSSMRGRPYIEVVRHHDFIALMDDVRKELSPGLTEFRLDRPDEKYLVVRVSPLFYRDAELSGFVAIFHDITQLNKLEQARKDFVANLSHEIKTPITAIQGFADTLLGGALHDEEHAARFIRTIKSNIERINGLVDDLMTISKLELGAIKLETTSVNLCETAEHVLALLSAKAAAKGLSLKTSINSPGKEIIADRDMVIQILTNLVDNAIKFTEKGGITFGTGEDEDRPFLFVEDTGIGIQKKHLPRLGERFYRVDPARSRKMGGTGLGLAIVKHLTKAHGWDMQLHSVYGNGTTVKIFTT